MQMTMRLTFNSRLFGVIELWSSADKLNDFVLSNNGDNEGYNKGYLCWRVVLDFQNRPLCADTSTNSAFQIIPKLYPFRVNP